MYDLLTMTDQELARLLRQLNERDTVDTYELIRAVVNEITRRQQAQR